MRSWSCTNMNRQFRKAIGRWRRQRVKIIGVAGGRKTGKDVFVGYLTRHYPGFRHVRIADAPARIAKVLGLRPERRIFHALFGVNALLKPIIGESAFKRRAAMILDKERPRFAVVEALRTKEEYREFIIKRKGILVGIEADDRIRYERALKDARRNPEKRDEGKMTFKEFVSKESSPIEREIAYIMQKAHIVIRNDYKVHHQFYQEVAKALKPLGLRAKTKK